MAKKQSLNLNQKKMARNQRDEPVLAAITACTDTSASDQKAPVNSCITALEKLGIVEEN